MDGQLGRQFPVSRQFESCGNDATGRAACARRRQRCPGRRAPLVAAFGPPATPRSAAPARALGQAVDVTLITAEDLPYPGIPTADVQASDPGMKAYAEAIQPWLDENPGVKLEQITFDVYDQEALLVAISGGTAPSFYPADVLGEWNEELVLATEKSGLAADVTDQVAQNDLEAKLADYCLALWKTKEVDGRHYALPYGYNCGDGIHYRIDLIKEAGLEEPTVDWTWDDLRNLAKALTTDEIKGIGMHTWGLALPLAAEGWGYTVLRNRLPAPETSWNWKWDFTTSGEEWADRIAWFRSMMFEDQSILADIAMEDDEIDAQFIQGTVAMANNNSTYHTRSPSPSVELSMARAADELGKPIEEVFGYVPHPVGNNGFNATSWGQLDTMALNPDLDHDRARQGGEPAHLHDGAGIRQPEESRLRADQRPPLRLDRRRHHSALQTERAGGYPGDSGRGVGRSVHEERALRRQPAADAVATLVHSTSGRSRTVRYADGRCSRSLVPR